MRLQPPARNTPGDCDRHSGVLVGCRRCAPGQQQACCQEENGVRCKEHGAVACPLAQRMCFIGPPAQEHATSR